MDARRSCGVIAVLVAVPALAVAGDVALQDYQACSSVVQDAVRLACYDKVSEEAGGDPAAAAQMPQEAEAIVDAPPRAAPAEVAAVSSESAAETAASAPEEERFAPLTDDVGLSSLERDGPEGPQGIRGTVTDCRLDASGKHLFYFDNGQVWKQSGTSRKKYEDCAFDVTIVRDAFGYRMLPDGETQRIRISRVR
jgi:hypothetical protein